MENGSEEHIDFLQNLQVVAIKQQLKETFNRECHMCNKAFFTSFHLDQLCNNCHEEVQELIQEFKHDE